MYLLDNEPDLWSGTHPRIHPAPVGAAELITRSSALAKAVKAVDPNAQVLGFESYGFNGYYSLQDAPDWPSVKGSYGWYIDYYLDKMMQQGDRGQAAARWLSVHWYPEAQGGGQRIVFGGAGSVDTQKARVQAPRSLWDPNYHETSWIEQCYGAYLPLLPRLQLDRRLLPWHKARLHRVHLRRRGQCERRPGHCGRAGHLRQVRRLRGRVLAGRERPELRAGRVPALPQLQRRGRPVRRHRRASGADNVADASVYAAISGADDTKLHSSF